MFCAVVCFSVSMCFFVFMLWLISVCLFFPFVFSVCVCVYLFICLWINISWKWIDLSTARYQNILLLNTFNIATKLNSHMLFQCYSIPASTRTRKFSATTFCIFFKLLFISHSFFDSIDPIKWCRKQQFNLNLQIIYVI